MQELSSLDVLFLARELGVLEDAYLDKIHETAPQEFLFRTRHPERGRAALLVRPGSFVCLVEEPPESPEAPTTFAALLRKHLLSSRVRRVEQRDFDRILVLHLDRRGEPLRLILELFGKGNLVLVGADDKIVLAQRTETFRDRTVKRGEAFQFPPARVNPVTLEPAEFERLALKSEKDAVRFLATELGLGGDLAEEILARAKVAKQSKARSLRAEELAEIWRAWMGLLHEPPSPALARGAKGARVEPLRFTASKFADDEREPMPTLSAAIDRARRLDETAAGPPVDEERERLERQVQHQAAAIEEFRREADRTEARGRLLYEHYADVEKLLKEAKNLVRGHEWSGLLPAQKAGQLPPWIRKVDPANRRLTVLVGDEEVALDPESGLDKNASLVFEDAKRIRAKIEGAQAALDGARTRLASAERPVKKEAPRAKAPSKRFWFESFRWFYTTEDFLVVGGRDASSNEKLVKKHLQTGDLYFHADFHGAPSCVLKAGGATVGDASLREAAQFAVAYSKAFAQFAAADAYWVKPEQVSKTAPSGEFVAKGAFVVRGQRNYLHQVPLELAIGLVGLAKDGKPAEPGVARRLMGGPPTAVARLARAPILVRRGSVKPVEAAKRLAPRLGVTLEEVQAVLPPGTYAIDDPGAGA